MQNLGASYWQVLPQINGYEICPLHNEPIRETQISHQDNRYKFYPASNELGKPRPGNDEKRIAYVKEHQKEFLQMALDICYLFQNSYYDFNLGARNQKMLQFDLLPVRHNWINKIWNDPVIKLLANIHCLENLFALIENPDEAVLQI